MNFSANIIKNGLIAETNKQNFMLVRHFLWISIDFLYSGDCVCQTCRLATVWSGIRTVGDALRTIVVCQMGVMVMSREGGTRPVALHLAVAPIKEGVQRQGMLVCLCTPYGGAIVLRVDSCDAASRFLRCRE